MAASKSFPGVTEAIFSCVKQASAKEHGTVYDPPSADQGTAKTKTIAGEVDLSFDLNPATSTLTYAILHKPGIVPESSIWDGIGSTIATCQRGR